MSTTTLRIDEALKARVAAAAERLGESPRAFIVETVELQQAQADFLRVADARWSRIQDTGRTVGWDEAQACLRARAAGQ